MQDPRGRGTLARRLHRRKSKLGVVPAAVCYPNPGRKAIRIRGHRIARLPPTPTGSQPSVEAASLQLIRESEFTVGPSAGWASTTGPGARGPSLSREKHAKSPGADLETALGFFLCPGGWYSGGRHGRDPADTDPIPPVGKKNRAPGL